MSIPDLRLEGLVPATHTPMHEDGSIAPVKICDQAEILARQGAIGVFVNGSTGEGVSLTSEERRTLAEEWSRHASANGLKLVVHVGHTSHVEARSLAEHAAAIGADAVSAMAPFYFRPGNPKSLVDWLEPVAKGCPSLPFYYYDIPSMTGVRVDMPGLADEAVRRIPNFTGIKYTSDDLVSLQELLHFQGGRLDVLFGNDECLLAALALGVRGAVGSSYNFAAEIYLEIIEAFLSGDFERARARQLLSVRLIRTIARFGYLPAAKRIMGLRGCDCGPVRPPLENLPLEKVAQLIAEVESLGVHNLKGLK
jgi:N-acetylneuraminate lyase